MQLYSAFLRTHFLMLLVPHSVAFVSDAVRFIAHSLLQLKVLHSLLKQNELQRCKPGRADDCLCQTQTIRLFVFLAFNCIEMYKKGIERNTMIFHDFQWFAAFDAINQKHQCNYCTCRSNAERSIGISNQPASSISPMKRTKV